MLDLDEGRPLKARDSRWLLDLAAQLNRAHTTPNLVIVLGVVFAVLGAAIISLAGVLPPIPRSVLLLFAAGAIGGRLVCNLLNGMVAAPANRADAAAPIWIALADRLSDILLLAGAGYMLFGLGWRMGPSLGWVAAVLAVITAYVRELGRGLGLPADVTGPMGGPRRMAALALGCALTTFEPLWNGAGQMMLVVMAVIVVGTGWTIGRRVKLLATGLRARQAVTTP